MQLGMVGLGRMGSNMVRRLMRGGHERVVFNVDAAAVETLAKEGAMGASSLEDLVQKLAKPRAVCIMLPAPITDGLADQLAAHLEPGDILIDGGNSHYHDDIARSKRLAAKGLHCIDMGTSGHVETK